MSSWKSCIIQFPKKFQLSNDEWSHLYCLFSDYFASYASEQRILLANWNGQAVYSWDTGHPWKFLSNDLALAKEDLQDDYTDLEHINDFDICRGTATFKKKHIKWDTASNCWTYLNNHVINFQTTSILQSEEGSLSEELEGEDTMKVEEILEWTGTMVTSAI